MFATMSADNHTVTDIKVEERATSVPTSSDDGSQAPISERKTSGAKARALRLEQNRKAAKESRRRKKMMIEELQRSVIFFSRCNGSLKQQNDELSRLLLQAQSQVAAIESGQQVAPKPMEQQRPPAPTTTYAPPDMTQQVQAQAVATQAIFESQGFPPAAARAAAQTMNGNSSAGSQMIPSAPPMEQPGTVDGVNMQPGASMQAMASFQQAAAVAMQAAMGMNPTQAPAAAPVHHHHHVPVPQFAVMQWQPQPQQQAQSQTN